MGPIQKFLTLIRKEPNSQNSAFSRKDYRNYLYYKFDLIFQPITPFVGLSSQCRSTKQTLSRKLSTPRGHRAGRAAGRHGGRALDGSGTRAHRRRAHDTRGPLARAQAAARAHAARVPPTMGIGTNMQVFLGGPPSNPTGHVRGSTLGAKFNKRCDRLKYQINFIVQINPIVFTAKSTVLGIRFLSNQSQEFLYGSHLYRGWALQLKRWDLCWT